VTRTPRPPDPGDNAGEARGDKRRKKRRVYEPPQVTPLGTLRDQTLGVSPGIGDSGGAGTFEMPARRRYR
jgi:hypothetical protein